MPTSRSSPIFMTYYNRTKLEAVILRSLALQKNFQCGGDLKLHGKWARAYKNY